MPSEQQPPEDPDARLLWFQGRAREKQIEANRLLLEARKLEQRAAKRAVQAENLRHKARRLRERSRDVQERGKRVRGVDDPVKGLLDASKHQEKANRLMREGREADGKAVAHDAEAVKLRQEARKRQLGHDGLLREVSEIEREIRNLRSTR